MAVKKLVWSEAELQRREVEIELGNKQFLLIEGSEDACATFTNMRMEGAQVDQQTGKVTVPKLGNLQSFLVSQCLFEVSRDTEGQRKLTPVARERIEKWQGRVVKELFETAKEISGLDEGVSRDRKAALAAFARPDSPVSLESLRTWLAKVCEEDTSLSPLAALLAPEKDDEVKN